MRDEKEEIQEEEEEDHKLNVAKLLLNDLPCDIVHIKNGKVRVNFTPDQQFICDKYNLVHSGLIDSVGQFCALMVINKPNGIVSKTQTEFLVPIKNGMALEFEATTNYNKVTKKAVKVVARHNGISVYESVMQILVLEEHIFFTNIEDMTDID